MSFNPSAAEPGGSDGLEKPASVLAEGFVDLGEGVQGAVETGGLGFQDDILMGVSNQGGGQAGSLEIRADSVAEGHVQEQVVETEPEPSVGGFGVVAAEICDGTEHVEGAVSYQPSVDSDQNEAQVADGFPAQTETISAMDKGDFGVTDVGSAEVVMETTSHNTEIHMISANEMDKGDTCIADVGSVADAPAAGSPSEDTHLVDEKSNGSYFVTSTSCLAVETHATVTHSLDENMMEKGDFGEELIPVGKTSMPETTDPCEISAHAFQENQSFDLLIGGNQDTSAFPAASFVNGNAGADAHGVESLETVSGDAHLAQDDLKGPGDFVTADVGSSKVVVDITLQNADTHMVDQSTLVKGGTPMADADSIAVAPTVSSQSRDTHPIDEKNNDKYLVMNTSCLMVESQATFTHPLDDNLMEKGDFVDELIPVAKNSMPETSERSQIQALAIQGNQSSDLLSSDNKDIGPFSAGSFTKGNVGADAHDLESSLGRYRMVVGSNVLEESPPAPDEPEVRLVQTSEAEEHTSAACDNMADVIMVPGVVQIGEQELLESSEKQILQPESVTPRTIYAENNQRVRYNLPQDTRKLSVSDLVWGKVKSYPWWPGQIFDHSDASDLALKHQRKDNFLVAYFADKTFAWRNRAKLKPFYTNFTQMEKQSSSDAFMYAVTDALGEVSRRMELGMTCSCLPEEEYTDIKCQKVVNAGIREGTGNSFFDRSLVVNYFQSNRLIEYIKALGQIPTGGPDRLEFVIAKAQLKAFYHSKGYPDLPEFVFGGVLMENDTEISSFCDKKPTEAAVVHSTTPLSSELFPGKRKRGRPPNKQNHIVGEISPSSDKAHTEIAVEHSTPSELVPGKRKRGRPRKNQKHILGEISSSSDKKPTEVAVDHSSPLSSELVPGKRKRDRPSKKQKLIFGDCRKQETLPEMMEEENDSRLANGGKKGSGVKLDKAHPEIAVEHHPTPLSSELVPGKRKRGRSPMNQKHIFGEISPSSDKKATEVAVDHPSPLSSEFVPGKRKRGRPPKTHKHILGDCRKQESLSGTIEEKNDSRHANGGKRGLSVKSAGLSDLSSWGKTRRVADSDFTDLGEIIKERLGPLGDLETRSASPNLGSSFRVGEYVASGGRKGKKDSDLDTKSPPPTLSSSFKVGEYIRRGASQLTGTPPIFKCHGEVFQKSVSKADLREGGVNPYAISYTMLKQRAKKRILEDYSSADKLLSQLCLAATNPMKGQSFLSVLVSFFTDFRNSCASSSSGASKHSEKIGQWGSKEALDSESASSDASIPDHMKDPDWGDTISNNSSGKGLLSNSLKRKGETGMQKKRKKRKSIGQPSPSCLVGPIMDTAQHLQLGIISPDMKPAATPERPIISVEEKIVDMPTTLMLGFNSSDFLPSEADLSRIFGHYGPLSESETEVLTKTNHAKVVFKRRADAEIAFDSAGSIFGPELVSYQLKDLPAAPETSTDYSLHGEHDAAPINGCNLEVSAQAET